MVFVYFFNQVEEVPLYYWFLRFFSMIVCWTLTDTFSASIDVVKQFFFCLLIDFWMLNQSSIPRINSTWLWYIILFIHCWVCFANTFLRIFIFIFLRDICCYLVIKSYPDLSESMDCSASGLLVLYYFLQFAQTHVPWVGDAIQPCHPLLPSSPPALSLSQHQSRFFASGGQSIGASALASILPMNIQDWFPLGLTGFISLQSKGLLRVFLREIWSVVFFSPLMSV